MSNSHESNDVMSLLSQIIDIEKLQNLVKSVNKRNMGEEMVNNSCAPPICNPKKITAPQKRQDMHAIIAKKFREKYKNY
jgi:hypothetical protein